MPERKTRDLALIGAGHWGKNLARNFHSLGVLKVICDPDPDILARMKEQYPDVETTSEAALIWTDPSITRVAVAAPAALHFRIANQALDAGKDVFVEKPLCLDTREAGLLVEKAENKGLILMVGHLLQYHPCIEMLRTLVASGELGKLYYITSNRLNLGKIRREENALWSFAPHDISVILSIAGNELPEEVRCVGEAYLDRKIADTTLTMLRFPGGMRAHVYVSWLNPFKEQKLTVVGSSGMVVFDDTLEWGKKLVLHRQYITWTDGRIPVPEKKAGEPIEVPQEEPLRRECIHFLHSTETRKIPRTDGNEGLRVLSVLRAAQESLEKNGIPCVPGVPETGTRDVFVHPTADLEPGANIGAGTRIWRFSHVMTGARIGRNCNIGQNVFVAGGAVIGDNCKIQNNVSVYSGVTVEDGVFLGPSCVLTNVKRPRTEVDRRHLYEKTCIRKGATIGANATVVCGVTIGRYAFVAAGAVVTSDVPDYGLVTGNPAGLKGWISRHGWPMEPGKDGIMVCPESGLRYKEVEPGVVRCLDISEDESLPESISVGKKIHKHPKG